jgi:hypothetical protein
MHKDYPDMVDKAKLAIEQEFVVILSNKPTMATWIALLKTRHPYNTMSDWKLLTEMRIGISGCYCNAGLNNCGFDEMWLTFIMKNMFKSQWDNSKKIWVEMG